MSTITYCDIDGVFAGTGNIRQDPRFRDVTDADPANWDVHLRLASPCIDVGDNGATGIPTTDIDGSARTVAADCDSTAVADMGADEFNVTCHCVASASTLNTALIAAQANGDNDVIRVAQGFYNSAFHYDGEGDALVLRGGYTIGCAAGRVIDPIKTVLWGSNTVRVLALYDPQGGDITVDGFTIQDGGAGYGPGIYIRSRSVSNPTGQSGTVTVTNNIITGNSATSGDGSGVYAESYSPSGTAGDVIVTNNLIYDNDANEFGGGVYAKSSTGDGILGTITVTNNTIADNTGQYGGGTWLELDGGGGTIECYNNIIWGNTAVASGDDIYLTRGSGTAQSSNNTYADMDGDGWEEEDFYSSSDPLFVGGGVYHLQPSSPCIDSGDGSAPAFPPTDIGGNTRVLDGDNDGTQTADRGGHEFVAYTVLHRDGANWNRAAGSGWDYSTPPYTPDSDFAVDMEYRADGTFLILHREGAIWDSDAGWILDTPPYYAGDDYARDLEFMSDGSYTILHKEGALWNSTAGWTLDTPPYYPGVDYARDLEYRSDDSYVILHQEGAIYNSDSSWTLGLPPYYPGTVWAQDLELKSNETDYAVLLHEQGAMWSTDAGWALTTPPYYPGIEWAADVELKADDTGYFILHEEGAIYDSATGWNTATPPYYSGTNYAVDLEVR